VAIIRELLLGQYNIEQGKAFLSGSMVANTREGVQKRFDIISSNIQ
jgi:hypothetical protein